MSIEKLRTVARELAGEAWDFERRHLVAQAHVRRKAARVLMAQADLIQREDVMFEDPQAKLPLIPTGSGGSRAAPPGEETPPRAR